MQAIAIRQQFVLLKIAENFILHEILSIIVISRFY